MPHSTGNLPAPPAYKSQIITKSSHSGRTTSASAATATAALAAVPFDPTGIALLTALGSGTLALGGLAYHGGHKVVHLVEGKVARHRAKKAGAVNQASSDNQTLVLSHPQAGIIPTTAPLDLQTELESCIRRLSCSVTGVVVTGSMTFVLPHFLLGVALNSAQLIHQARRLHHLTALAEAKGGVHRYISSTDITVQVMSGILIKSAILLCTLGADVDTAIDGFSQLLVSAEVPIDPALIPDTWQQAEHVHELYDGLTANTFLHSTGEIAGEPANFVAGLLGYQDMPTWASDAPAGDVMKIGAANVLVDLATGKLVEDPTHEVLDFASRLGRRFGWGDRAELKDRLLKKVI